MAAHLCDRVNELARARACVRIPLDWYFSPTGRRKRAEYKKVEKKIRHAAGQAANIAAGDVGDEKRYCTE